MTKTDALSHLPADLGEARGRARSGDAVPPAAADGRVDRGGAAVHALLLPLLHGRLRPAARDHPPRHPHRLRAGPDLPRVLGAQERQRADATRKPARPRSASACTTGCWRSPPCLASLYVPWVFHDLQFRVGNPDTLDWVMGTIMIVVLLEATRRSVGWPLPIIAVAADGLRPARPLAARASSPTPATPGRAWSTTST